MNRAPADDISQIRSRSGADELALQSARVELQQLVYVVSHDLRAPLRSVRGFADLLSSRLGEGTDDTTRKYLNHIVAGAHHLQSLLDDLVDYSRVETRGQPLEPTDSADSVSIALQNLSPDVSRSNARVEVMNDLPTVLADPTQLWQVFRQLIDNAIKFSRGQPQVQVSAQQDGERWIFRVSDNGVGIPHHERERIFHVFTRLHGPDEYPGNGIGLALARRVVERHNGTLWVDEHSHGSTFAFTLAAHVPPAAMW